MLSKALFIGLSPFFALSLFALPEGVQANSAQIINQDSTLHISTQNERAVIDWNSFSIDVGEAVKFQQPAITSAVLNRVMGSEMSQLLGLLESNGQVFLINPHGVIIGKDAQINTASFCASTYPVGGFLEEGELLFSGDSTASIVHMGNIAAPNGNVALIAHKIEVSGTIKGNTVSLASGHEVLLKPSGDTIIHIRPDLKGEGIENHGTIQALETIIQTDGAHSLGIHQTGSIEAMKLENVGGRILLRADNSTLSVSGELSGETIHLFGEKVHLENQAIIDASGDFGGGEILVGGDFQGNNSAILNATETFVGADVQLKADATIKGDGGKIIVWSDEATAFYGRAAAKGGELGGDGGLVEVSGDHLVFEGFSDTSAPLGKIGTLLLDPADITIAGANLNYSFVTTGPTCASNPTAVLNITANPVAISAASLVAQLATNCVTLNTSGGSGGTGTITVSSAVNWSAATTLSLVADSNIIVSVLVSNTSATTGFTALSLSANQAATAAGATDGILISGTAQLSTVGGDITLNGRGGSTGASGITLSATTAGGAVKSTNGNITLTGIGSGSSGTHYGVSIPSGTGIVVSGSGNITFTGCSGGGSGTSANPGIGIGTTSTTAVSSSTGAINFGLSGVGNGITGGSGTGTSIHGLNIAIGTVAARTITAQNITGGPNATGTSCGIQFGSGTITIGNSSTQSISLQATGGSTAGSGNLNSGIELAGGGTMNLTVAANGTITFNGTGGGNPATASTTNYGIRLVQLTNSFNGPANVTFTGTGGSGTGGSNHGFYMDNGGAFAPGTIGTLLTFLNCTGGTGGSSAGASINTLPNPARINVLTFQGCHGGSDGGNGVTVSGNPSALSIVATDCVGGAGNVTGSNNVGFFFNSATMGIPGFTTGISITATGGGTSSGNDGIQLAGSGTLLILKDGGTVTLNGSGGGGASGNTSYGVNLLSTAANGFTVGVAAPGSVSITGIGGTGSGGTNHGINLVSGSTGTTFNLFAGTPITFTGTAGNAALATSHGINTSSSGTTPNVTVSGTGTMAFTGTGGSGAFGGNGINIGGATNFASSNGNITFTGSGSGTSGNNHGVFLNGTGTVATSGTGSVLFQNCFGGGSGTSGNGGVTIQQGVSSTSGSVQFSSIRGGTGNNTGGTGNSGWGVFTSSSITAPTITGTDIVGSVTGGSNCYGFIQNSATLGSSTTSAISITASGGGTLNSAQGSNNIGIHLLGTVLVGGASGGSITLNGTGGGNLGSGTGGSNTGVNLSGTFTLGNGGDPVPSVLTLSGVGGLGNNGSNNGVSFNSGSTITLNAGSSVNVSNSRGGSGSNGGNIGVFINKSLATTGVGALSFTNITGGSGGSNNSGVYIDGITLLASTISVTNVSGGSGASSNFGIRIDTGASVQTTASGTITLSGSADTTSLYGIYLSDAAAQIIAVDGNISLSSPSSSIFVGNATLIQSHNGNISAIADKNFVTSGGATIQSTGSGNITLVVDNAFPTSPGVGSGVFNIPSLTLLANGGMVKLYGGVLRSGFFPSTINSSPYVAGLHEQEPIYYPGGTYPSGSPYFIYYKSVFSVAQQPLFVFRMATSEAFQKWNWNWYGNDYLTYDDYAPCETAKGLNMIIPSLVYSSQ